MSFEHERGRQGGAEGVSERVAQGTGGRGGRRLEAHERVGGRGQEAEGRRQRAQGRGGKGTTTCTGSMSESATLLVLASC